MTLHDTTKDQHADGFEQDADPRADAVYVRRGPAGPPAPGDVPLRSALPPQERWMVSAYGE